MFFPRFRILKNSSAAAATQQPTLYSFFFFYGNWRDWSFFSFKDKYLLSESL